MTIIPSISPIPAIDDGACDACHGITDGPCACDARVTIEFSRLAVTATDEVPATPSTTPAAQLRAAAERYAMARRELAAARVALDALALTASAGDSASAIALAATALVRVASAG